MTDHRMKRPLGAVAVLALGPTALLALGLAFLPAPAQAQFFGGWGGWDNGGGSDGMAPQQVRRAIAERGFRVLAPLRRNGNVFVADVLDGRGQHERLIVAAADAQILQRFIVDDGRGAAPRAPDDGRGFVVRGADEERGLVPPVDIPDGRRFARPADRDVPPQRFGDLGAEQDGEAPTVLTAPPRILPPPPIRTVKPRPRLVERTPETPSRTLETSPREPGGVEATPLAPAAPRPAPAPVAKAAAPAPVLASRPEPAPAPTAAPAAVAPQAPAAVASRRMTDPLAIPAGDAAGKPVRNVASGITGTPAPAAGPAAKPGDVPVAPLD